jgi:ribosomal protein S18 acetylase RimI-like enzyme
MHDLPTTLLVRRASPPGTASLLTAAGLTADVVAELASGGGVFVLGDVSHPPSTPPLAAMAVRRAGDGRAVVAGIAVVATLRRRGLARRLLTDTITLLQADGTPVLEAVVAPGTPAAALLRSAGFAGEDRYRDGPGEHYTREL